MPVALEELRHRIETVHVLGRPKQVEQDDRQQAHDRDDYSYEQQDDLGAERVHD